MRDSYWQEGLARPFSTLIRVIELMIIGLTGGMGCGKSTAARLFSDRGFRRLDSDQVVRDEVLTDPAVVAALRAQWGEAVAPGGVVDRGVVADRAFADDAARLWLESVIHPPGLCPLAAGPGGIAWGIMGLRGSPAVRAGAGELV